jgi:hypothetical protein
MATKKFLLTWTPPLGNAPISGYKTEYTLSGSGNWTLYDDIFTSNSGFVTGLDPCTHYDFRVFAYNSLGSGTYSDPDSGIMGNIPFAPTSLSGVATDTTIDFSWVMPNNGGCAITKSLVEYKGTGDASYTVITLNNSGTNYTISGLTASTGYDLRVRSVNIVGTGTYSSGIVVQTLAVPGQTLGLNVQYIEMLDAPTGINLSINGTTATLTWSTIATTNLVPLSGYYIRYRNTSGSNWSTSSLFTTTSGNVSSLTGTGCYSYEFGVAGLNISGTIGDYSPATTGNFGTSATPTNIYVSNGGGYYSISWTSGIPDPTGFNMYISGVKRNNTPFNPNLGSIVYNGDLSYDEFSSYYTFSGTSPDNQTLQISSVNACGESALSTGVTVPSYM